VRAVEDGIAQADGGRTPLSSGRSLVLADAAIQAYTHITGPQSGKFGHAGGNQRNFTVHSAGASASPRLLQSLCVSLVTPA
jgi:hypothetical protein